MKCLLAMGLLVLSHALWAHVRIDSAICHIRGDMLTAEMKATIQLPDAPATAIKSGLTLELVQEANIRRQRRWWPARTIVQHRQRLSYNPISQQYILDIPATRKRLSFAYLGDALSHAAHVQPVFVTEAVTLSPVYDYDISVRLRLDSAQLPVSLRLDALFNPQWDIASEWFPCQLVR